MQVSRDDVVLHLTGHQGDSCPGSKAMAEIRGLLAYHYFLVQKDYSFTRSDLEKTSWSEKVMQAEVIDTFRQSHCVYRSLRVSDSHKYFIFN